MISSTRTNEQLTKGRLVTMQTVVFEMKTITPLFLAGADQEKAELRAPSFRGLMRYWQRALVGGIVGTTDQGLKQVVEAETKVFGTTDTGSSFTIRISAPNEKPKQFIESITNGWKDGKPISTGKGYLLWSMRLKKPPRYYFDKNTRFRLSLTTFGADTLSHQRAIAALWLLTRLGAVGSRSRRCAGSLSIQAVQGDAYQFAFGIPADANTLKAQIEQGIARARALYKQNTTSNAATQSIRFDILSAKTCRIWILQYEAPWQSSDDAIRAIGESLQTLRGGMQSFKRKLLGFSTKTERRASSLLLRVAELQNNKYVGIAILFKTTDSGISPRDYNEIEQWANTFSGKKEITL